MATNPGGRGRKLPAAKAPVTSAQLMEELERRTGILQALYEVAGATGRAGDPMTVARLATDHARKLLGVDEARLYWYDPEIDSLRPLADSRPQSTLERAPTSGRPGILEFAFRQQEPVVVEDYPGWEYASPLGISRGVRSAAAVPLMVGSRPLGALMVRSSTPRHFEPQDVELLALFAAQVGPALEATRLYGEAERRRAEAAALVALVHQGATEPDPERVIDFVAERACLLVGADYGALALREADGSLSWHGIWGSQSDAATAPQAPSPHGSAVRALESGHTVVLERLGENPEFPLEQLPFHRAQGGRTVLATPLASHDYLLGAFVLGWRSDVALTDEQIELAEALAGHAATIIDSARAHAEVAAGAEELRLRYEAVACGILVIDPSGHITHANKAAEEMFGMMAQQMLGRPMPSLWRAVDDNGFDIPWEERPAIKALHTKARVRRATIGIFRPDGELRWHQVDAVPVLGEDGQALHVVSSFIDVTERERAQEEIKRLNEELEERVAVRTRELLAANQELEAFSYSVSHDLRAPLRSIDGFSQALLEDCGALLDQTGEDYLGRIRAATRRMGGLIDDLLALAHVSRYEMGRERVDLSGLARSIGEQLSRSEPQRQLTYTVAKGLTTGGDPHLLRLVLENLLGNAWKFTAKHPQARIEFGAKVESGEPIYFVRDDGVGFSMAYADKLFRPFQRLHSTAEFEGSGVGLATVHRIVQRHGGRAWAEGALEQGATFYFTLGESHDAPRSHHPAGGRQSRRPDPDPPRSKATQHR